MPFDLIERVCVFWGRRVWWGMSRFFLVSWVVVAGCISPVLKGAAGRIEPDAGRATTGEAADASVSVDFTRDSGVVPSLFRLGVQVNGAADEVNAALAVEHKLGHLRLDLGYTVMSQATSLGDAVARVNRANMRAQVAAMRATGAEITLNLVETPRYLSSCPEKTATEPISGWPTFSTCPPKDLAAWSALVAAIVTAVGQR